MTNSFKKNRYLRKILLVLVIFIIIEMAFLLFVFLILKTQNVENDARRIISKCASDNETYTICLSTQLSRLTYDSDLEYGKKVLNRIQSIDRNTVDCHLIAHSMSSAEIKKDPSKWKDLIRKQDVNVCVGGFFHGILDGYLILQKEKLITSTVIQNICGLFRDNDRNYDGCIHTMGHFALVQTYPNLDDALKICDGLGVDSLPERCFDGIFMEDNTGLSLEEHGIIKKTEPINEEITRQKEKYCNSLTRASAFKACWTEMGRIYMKLYDNNLNKSFERCQSSPVDISDAGCANFAILEAVFLHRAITPSALKNMCDMHKVLSYGWKSCVLRVSSLVMNANTLYVPNAIKFCGLINDSFSQTCYLNVVTFIQNSQIDDKEGYKLCRMIPANFRERCSIVDN